jgi:hypothetical protein
MQLELEQNQLPLNAGFPKDGIVNSSLALAAPGCPATEA